MDEWGQPTTLHISLAWSWSFDTLFKWTNQFASLRSGSPAGSRSWQLRAGPSAPRRATCVRRST